MPRRVTRPRTLHRARPRQCDTHVAVRLRARGLVSRAHVAATPTLHARAGSPLPNPPPQGGRGIIELAESFQLAPLSPLPPCGGGLGWGVPARAFRVGVAAKRAR